MSLAAIANLARKNKTAAMVWPSGARELGLLSPPNDHNHKLYPKLLRAALGSKKCAELPPCGLAQLLLKQPCKKKPWNKLTNLRCKNRARHPQRYREYLSSPGRACTLAPLSIIVPTDFVVRFEQDLHLDHHGNVQSL